jgi:primase-polymerase (primpol)-like protein
MHTYQRLQQAQRPYDGVGFMFHGEITSIDWDHCIAPDGTIDAWARKWIEGLSCYREHSAGQEGIHTFVYGCVQRH